MPYVQKVLQHLSFLLKCHYIVRKPLIFVYYDSYCLASDGSETKAPWTEKRMDFL